MIEFVTLFLGLTTGIHPVEIAVGPDVALVEVVLDSQSIGIIQGEPWRISCDFGPRLLPHKLEVVGRNREGTEIGRAEQWLNLPRQRAEAKLSLHDDEGGQPRSARLIWEAVDSTSPREVRVLLDGAPLPVTSLDRIELPPTDPEATHVLTAELEFADGISATAEAAFGGSFGDVVSTDITAVVLRSERSRLPKISDLQGRLEYRGSPLRIVAVEKPAIEIIVVREQSTALAGALQRLVTMGGAQRVPRYSLLPRVLGPADRVSSVFTVADPQDNATGPYELMPISTYLARPGGPSLFRLLTSAGLAGRESLTRQRVADAVAVGGLVASAGNRRRAVILLTTKASADVSRLAPALARDYLANLQVPLLIWRFHPPGGDKKPMENRWRGSTEIADWGDFAKAYRTLTQLLESQFIVWVDGLYLRREITLSDGNHGLSLVGDSTSETAAEPAQPPRLEARRSRDRPSAEGSRLITLIDSDRLETARRHLGEDAKTLQIGQVTLITDHAAPRLWKSLERLTQQVPNLFSRHYGLPANLESGVAVVLYSTQKDYRAFELASGVDSSELSGYSSPGLVALYAGGKSRRQIEATFTHELTHQLLFNVLGLDLPPWLAEGLAESMTFAATDTGGALAFRRLESGRSGVAGRFQLTGPFSVLDDLGEAIQGERLPTFEELRRVPREEFGYAGQGQLLYALSAFWVHYLSTAEDDVRERFNAFLARIAAGQDARDNHPVGPLGDEHGSLEENFRSWLLRLALELES